ncbi:Aspartate aminotransferase, cytoplasmic [Apophysomyces sp. BC1021]|nr:Aspartate aminotransferase, cytoplasmic [Apophysomyces sp. BC1021]
MFHQVPSSAEEPSIRLQAEYNVDCDPYKINVVGSEYKTRRLRPWVFPVVKKAKSIMFHNPELDHEYPPMGGVTEFVNPAVRLLLGSSDAIQQGRVARIQTLASTGGMHTGAVLLALYQRQLPTVYVANVAGDHHRRIFAQVGFQVKEYPYYAKHALDYRGLLRMMRYAPRNSLFVLPACGHPSGVDPTPTQWRGIADVMQHKSHLPFFDCSYQGLASGDLDKDAWAVRYFVARGFELFAVQSFSTIFGLANERVGNLTVVCRTAEDARRVFSQLEIIQRGEVLGPPLHGLRIISLILNDPEMFAEWKSQLRKIHRRVTSIRKALYDHFTVLQTPGTWHIKNQKGMFWWIELNASQLKVLKDKYHIYAAENGHICLAGLSKTNVGYFAKAVDEALRQ